MLLQVWRMKKNHPKITTRQHKWTFCWSTTSNQWKSEYSEMHLISSYHRHLISTNSGGWITKVVQCQINETIRMNHSNISLQVCVLPLHTSREKTTRHKEQSHVRGEGNYADYAHFSKYRKPLVISAPRCISDNVSVHYKQTKLIFMFIADAPRWFIIHILSYL